jgi:hypothetical protein
MYLDVCVYVYMHVYISCMYMYVCVLICLYLLSVSAGDVVERAFGLMLRFMITGKQKPFFFDMLGGMMPKYPAGRRDLSERYISYLDKKSLKGRQIHTDIIEYRHIHTDTAWAPGPGRR